MLTKGAAAHEDSVSVQHKEYGPARVFNGEFILGYMHSAAKGNIGLPGESQGVESAISREGYYFGFGYHIPLFRLDAKTTLWLVPSAHLGFIRAENEGNFDLGGIAEIPIHITYSYGALRRKYSRWGGEVGVGVNLRYNGFLNRETFRVVPSAMFDISYTTPSPGNVYRIRFTSDVFSTTQRQNVSVRQFSVGIIIGMPENYLDLMPF